MGSTLSKKEVSTSGDWARVRVREGRDLGFRVREGREGEREEEEERGEEGRREREEKEEREEMEAMVGGLRWEGRSLSWAYLWFFEGAG